MPSHPPRRHRSTASGEHRPVMLEEVRTVLALRPGMTVVDCTLGFAGHSVEILKAIGPTGRLIALDRDAGNLPQARERLAAVSDAYEVHHANFAGLLGILAGRRADAILADLGFSSMQVDDPARGFSYMREGPLDMRMDRSRGKTAKEILAEIAQDDLAAALSELGDEPQAQAIAAAIVRQRGQIVTTTQLADVIRQAAPVVVRGKPKRGEPTIRQQQNAPLARCFQALRILVNRELANLTELLRTLPNALSTGGRVAIVSFHSGEDRLVKQAFRDGLRVGTYAAASDEPLRASFAERQENPRSRSAKLRWARLN